MVKIEKPSLGLQVVGFAGDTIDSIRLRWKNADRTLFDFTGHSAVMTIQKRSIDAADLLILTSENGGIVLNDVDFNIKATINSEQSTTLGVGMFQFSLVITHINYVRTYVYGTLQLKQRA